VCLVAAAASWLRGGTAARPANGGMASGELAAGENSLAGPDAAVALSRRPATDVKEDA